MDEGDTAVHATKTLLEDASVNYVIDAQGSTFVAQAFATGMLSAFGHDPRIAIRTFGGELSFNLTGSTVEGARLNIRIQADSLEVTDDISAKDKQEIYRKMCEEVLETDRFPEIVYECSRVSTSGSSDRCWVALNGDLTLHGVTRSVPVSARVVINGSSVRATGDFSVRQSDYEIAAVSAAGGTIKLKDEVKLTFDIVARKKE
jgi:polyisoprenoid-binding protein YceI